MAESEKPKDGEKPKEDKKGGEQKISGWQKFWMVFLGLILIAAFAFPAAMGGIAQGLTSLGQGIGGFAGSTYAQRMPIDWNIMKIGSIGAILLILAFAGIGIAVVWMKAKKENG